MLRHIAFGHGAGVPRVSNGCLKRWRTRCRRSCDAMSRCGRRPRPRRGATLVAGSPNICAPAAVDGGAAPRGSRGAHSSNIDVVADAPTARRERLYRGGGSESTA